MEHLDEVLVLGLHGHCLLGFLVLTQRGRRAERIERHRVIVVPGARINVAELVPGEAVYAD